MILQNKGSSRLVNFNPAVGVGSILVNAIAGGGSLTHIWLYLVGPLAGGAVAAVVFKLQHPNG